MNKRIHKPLSSSPNKSFSNLKSDNNQKNQNSSSHTLVNPETSSYFSPDPIVIPYHSNVINSSEVTPRYLSIFDFPNIHEVVKLAKSLAPVYQAIRPYTLPSVNPTLASKLYSVVRSRIRNQKTFLPVHSQIEKYSLSFNPSADDLKSYAKSIFNSKIRGTHRSKNFVISTDFSVAPSFESGVILYLEPTNDSSVTSITVNNKQEVRDVLIALSEYFTFNIKSWLNVHLVSNIDQSLKNHELIKLYAACYHPASPHPPLFRNDSPDGNVSVFCSKYDVSAKLSHSRYVLVTLKAKFIDQDVFSDAYPKIKQYYHVLHANNANFSIVMKSDKVDLLVNPPHDIDIYKYIYDHTIFVPIIEDSRRFTLVTNQKMPFDLVRCVPFLDNFNINRSSITINMRGVKTIGLIANKASGKSSIMSLLPKRYVIIDSDIYGQLLNHLRVTLTESGEFARLKEKDYEWLYGILDDSLIIDENIVKLKEPDVPSFIELTAERYLTENNLDLSNILYDNAINKHLVKFKTTLNAIYSMFPLESYYHVICDWALRKFSSTEFYRPSTYCVVFGHYSYELYSLLGGAMFYLAFPGDLKLNLFLRDRDTPVDTDLFLQKLYELLETRSYNSQPSGLMLEVLVASGDEGTDQP